MARPKKDGLDYFPVDVNPDEKIEAIESIHKNNGTKWILEFWRKAYKTLTGLVDFNGLFGELFANKCRITTEEHENILKTAIAVEFCYEYEPGIYTSKGIQKRISSVSKDRKEAIDRQNKSKEKKSKKKLKESKVKDCPDYSPNNPEQSPNNCLVIPDHLKEVWPEYLKMRKLIKKPATIRAQKNIIAKLVKLSSDKNTQVLIVEQSINGSWQDVYELKVNNNKKIVPEFQKKAADKYGNY